MKVVKVSYNSLIKAAVVAGHMPGQQSLSAPLVARFDTHFQAATYLQKMLQQLPLVYKYLQVFTSSEGVKSDYICRVERSPKFSVSFSTDHVFHQTCQAKRPTS